MAPQIQRVFVMMLFLVWCIRLDSSLPLLIGQKKRGQLSNKCVAHFLNTPAPLSFLLTICRKWGNTLDSFNQRVFNVL